jgi:SAM-dependent methyltransferase
MRQGDFCGQETKIVVADRIEISERNLKHAQSLNICPEIHSADFVYHSLERRWKGDRDRAVLNYFNIGKYSANLAKDLVDEAKRIKERTQQQWAPKSILDFASGYGSASRHLSAHFPGVEVSACDIHSAAVKFNREVLGLTSFQSVTMPEGLDVPKHDIIVVMSFFSHMPDLTYGRWLRALARCLAPGGVLIFTANGFVTDRTGNTGITPDGRGFGFRSASEQFDLDGSDYGLTISYPAYVFNAMRECPNLRLSRFHEGLWWTTQDTYVCMLDA